MLCVAGVSKSEVPKLLLNKMTPDLSSLNLKNLELEEPLRKF